VLLFGLLVYDIYFVFFTPIMVMLYLASYTRLYLTKLYSKVSVATDFEAPVKMVFPRSSEENSGFAMLGLGM